jgi:hypothetical protein
MTHEIVWGTRDERIFWLLCIWPDELGKLVSELHSLTATSNGNQRQIPSFIGYER